MDFVEVIIQAQPALSWGAKLNMTKMELELITDPDMYILFEKDMRSGTFYISTKYSKANNKYLKSYDPKQESIYIIFLVTNNLYGYAMFKFLTTSGYKSIDLNKFDLNKYTSNSSKECVPKVGLEYLKGL